MDPVTDARALAAGRFPYARAAFLGGGVLTQRRTATSDLDIVVILAGPPAPYRESVRFREWPVELFVEDEQSLAFYFAKDVARRQPTMPRLCADGVVLADRDGLAGKIQAQAAALLAAGPPPVPSSELDGCRYGLCDLLDDLAGSTDPGESLVISWHIFATAARLALLLGGHWLGTGKWLLRELRDLDPGLADRMLAALADPARLTQVTDELLVSAGGRAMGGLPSGRPCAGRRLMPLASVLRCLRSTPLAALARCRTAASAMPGVAPGPERHSPAERAAPVRAVSQGARGR